jgi:hypothetical protein
MNNIVLIAVADALQELVDDDCRVVLCKAAALRYFLQECATLNVLHNDVQVLRVVEVLVNTHDVRVVQRFQNFNLVDNSLCFFLIKILLFYPLYGSLLLCIVVSA